VAHLSGQKLIADVVDEAVAHLSGQKLIAVG
jgi:hypothetical protein